jgi:hypothetical protein
MSDETLKTDRQNLLTTFQDTGRSLLTAQTRALDAIIHDLVQMDSDRNRPDVRVPLLMLQAVGVSVHSVLALTRERSMAIRDGFGIARSAVETALNAAYISTAGATQAELSIRYMRQKRWRDLNRQGSFGDVQVTVVRDIGRQASEFPGLEEALAEFTDRKGRERRTWTQLSIEDRIATVANLDRQAGIAFGSAVFAIYRPASELLHGSYYGVNYFWQGSRDTPARTAEAFDALWVTEHFVTLLCSLFFAVSGAVSTIAAVHRLPLHPELQDRLAKQLGHLIEAMNDADPNPDNEHEFTTKPK